MLDRKECTSMRRVFGWILGVGLVLASGSLGHAAMWGSQNGAALYGLAGEGGTYTSCTKSALSAVNDQPALIAMSCSGANKAFGFRFTIPAGESPTTINLAVSNLGNATGAQAACLSLQCGCGGNNSAEADLTDLTYGAASVMTISSAAGWDATESKTTVTNSVALNNGGEYRSCVCRAVRGTAGGCTDNWTGSLDVESIAFNW